MAVRSFSRRLRLLRGDGGPSRTLTDLRSALVEASMASRTRPSLWSREQERDPYAHWKQRSANHVVGEEPVRGAEGAERRHPSRLRLASEAAIRAWAPFPIASHFGTLRVEFELRRRRAAPPTIDTN